MSSTLVVLLSAESRLTRAVSDKEQILDWRAHGTRLRKLLAATLSNQKTFVSRCLEHDVYRVR